MSKKKQSINYLDLIPQRAETLRWHTDEATGLITLEVENTGVFNTIAQKVFHKPRTLVGGSVAVGQAQIVIFGLEVHKRKDQFVLDHLPQNAGHFVAVHLDEGRGHFDLFHSRVPFPLFGSFLQPRCTARCRAGSSAECLFAVSGCQLFKGRQAALDLFGIDAVGKAHIALDTEAVAGHQQQIKLPGLHAESVGILFQSLGEDVEGTAGALHLKAQRGELIVQQVHVGLIHTQITGHILTAAYGPSQSGRTAT